jgi:hypothetical protein
MECVKSGCDEPAIRGSNYCRKHQPRSRSGPPARHGRRAAAKKMAKKR